eukprot:5852328-Prymnesium_polylepis.1
MLVAAGEQGPRGLAHLLLHGAGSQVPGLLADRPPFPHQAHLSARKWERHGRSSQRRERTLHARGYTGNATPRAARSPIFAVHFSP